MQQAGGEALGVTVDVTDAQQTQAMAEQTVQRFGRLDILVHKAALYGGLPRTPCMQSPDAAWERVLAVNGKGLWLCCKAVVPVRQRQGSVRRGCTTLH